jgi:carboxyl-terminal processing protease
MVKPIINAAFSIVIACLAAPCAQGVEHPIPGSASEALTSVMRARHAAQALAGPNARAQELQQAATQLEELRTLLDGQPYRDFSSADSHLYAERLNIAIPLAGIYARLQQREKALQALETTTNVALIPVLDTIAADPDLATLRDEPRFKAVLAKYQRGAIASKKSFATPFSQTLTRAQRIAGLSHFWSEVRHNFANVDLMPARDWDAIYLEYLGKVMKTQSTAEYYAILMQLAPLLHDGHTNIYAPQQLAGRFYARPPLRTELVDDTVVVRAVHDARLGRLVNTGDQVVAINGIAVKTYAEKFVAPFVSSSTVQDRQVRMYDYELFAGDQKAALTLTLKDAKGQVKNVRVARSLRRSPPPTQFPFHVSPDGVAYLRLDHFESDEGVKAFKQALPQIRRAKALVLDVRTNGGGSTVYGLQILSHLVDKPIELTAARVRFEEQSFRAASGDQVGWRPLPRETWPVDTPADERFTGPVALLVGPKTFSAAEDFAAIFEQTQRGILVGEATGGSTGQPLMLDLPGGGQARICVKRDSYADGRDFVGKGIAPGFIVKNTLAAVRAGTDPVLTKAEALLLAGAGRGASAP